MIDFLIIYSIFSYLFVVGVLMAIGLESKHIPGALAMFIMSPIAMPVLTGYGFVIIGDK